MGKYLVHGASRETGKSLEMVVEAASAESAANTAADRGLLVSRVERHAGTEPQPMPAPQPAAQLIIRCGTCEGGEMQRVQSSRFGDVAWLFGAAATALGGLLAILGLLAACLLVLGQVTRDARLDTLLDKALGVVLVSCAMLAVASIGGIASSQRRDWVCRRCGASIPCGEVPTAASHPAPREPAR